MSKKSLINKRDRSSLTQNRKPLSEFSFEEFLEVYWKQYCTTNVPKIKILSHEQSVGNFSNIDVKINGKNSKTGTSVKGSEMYKSEIILIFNELQTILNCIIFKSVAANRGILMALSKILKRLEYCGLKNTDIRTIRTILQIYPNIRNLSINGNPNHFQNFYILIKGTPLFHLSTRFCQINDRGIKLMSNQLKVPYDHPLLSIDLSSNFISDVGAVFISEVLRINRTLISLNIADNWITDLGVHTIVTVLGKFILTQDECVIRRRGVFNYLKDKAKMMELHQAPSSMMKFERDSQKKITRAHSLSPSERKGSYAKKSSQNIERLYSDAVELVIKPDQHPFVKDTYCEEKEIWCTGNLILANLNLSYNKITALSLDKIRQVFYHQRELTKGNGGLISIIMQGTFAQNEYEEINYIHCLKNELARFSISSSTSKSSKRRKSPVFRVRSSIK